MGMDKTSLTLVFSDRTGLDLIQKCNYLVKVCIRSFIPFLIHPECQCHQQCCSELPAFQVLAKGGLVGNYWDPREIAEEALCELLIF